MHPRERRSSRRQFLFASAGAAVALSGADALLRAADALGSSVGVPIGPGGIPLARRNHPVTLPLYSDNGSIAAGKNTEKGPLNVFNWSAYINPAVVKEFEKQYKVSVNITTFENEEEALAKLTSGQASFDVWFATVEYLSRAVAGKLIQPVNHSYLPEPEERLGLAAEPVLRRPFPVLGAVHGLHDRNRLAEGQGQDPTDVVQERLRRVLARAGLFGEGRDPRRPA